MKRRRLVTAVLVASLVGAGVFWVYQRYHARETNEIQASGTIEATSVELNARMAGSIKRLSIREGDAVQKGQLVAEMYRSDLVAQRERDALGVLKAKAQLADLTSGARAQEIEEAAANAELARVNYEKAAAELQRRETLFREGAIAEEEVERFRTNLELEKNRLQAARARLSLLESGNRPQQITAARLEVERSKAVLRATEAMLEDLKVYSPITGVVVSKNYQEGEYVQAGASLATVADLSDMWIKVYIPTDDLPSVKLGQKVQFTVSGDPRVYQGIVEEIASRGEFTPKTIQTKQERTNVVFGVKIRILDPNGRLKPGMPADVSFGRG